MREYIFQYNLYQKVLYTKKYYVREIIIIYFSFIILIILL